MTNTHFATSGTLGAKFYGVSTDPLYGLGANALGSKNSSWVYVQADGAVAAYDWVGIDENFQAAKLTSTMADAGWAVGVAQVAFADNEYGWVAVRGTGLQGNVLTSCAADIVLHTSATAGSLDDATSVGTRINGPVVITAQAGTSVAANVEVMIIPMAQAVTF